MQAMQVDNVASIAFLGLNNELANQDLLILTLGPSHHKLVSIFV